ncbi:MAG: FAD-binding oxidoreductase [Chloroflexi bacterium OHK40]
MAVHPSSETFPLELRAIGNFRRRIAGELILRGEPGYEEARQHWNAQVDRYPGFIVRPRDAGDIATAIAFARAFDLPLAVRSGGHNGAGLALCDDGVVVDLSRFDAVTLDPTRRIARAQPGATNGKFVSAAAAHGLATTTGNAAGVGLGGLTLGGGIGWLMGKHGLTIDNVRSFQIVTADGQLRTASASEHPELFWALRGGGGNFGIVTEIEYQLHPLERVLAGRVVIPLADARAGLQALRALDLAAPDELTTMARLVTPPRIGPALVVDVCYSGDDLAAGERLLAPLRASGLPAADSVAPMAYANLYAEAEPMPVGLRFSGVTTTLPVLSDGAVEALLVAAASRPTPFATIMLQRLHGAASRVATEATAFALRAPQYFLTATAAWQSGPAEPQLAWAGGVKELLRPYAGSGSYVNFLGRGEPHEVRDAYGPNLARLAAIKARYDPENIFRLNQNIPPQR